MAVSHHVGLIGQTVTDKIPFTKTDPNDHPMVQLNAILDIATKVKDEAARLCEAITKIVEASQKLSDKCHALQLHTVVRTEDATHAESEDANQGPHDVTLSIADRLKGERVDRFDGNAEMKAKIAALKEELNQATPKSTQLSPSGPNQHEGDAATASVAQPKATGCPPKEEQPESKRQKAMPVKFED